MRYGIIGSGSANPKVIQEGLLDIVDADKDASFVVHARRSPQGAVSDVYDFLVDNEMRFDAVHRIDDNAPKGLLNYAIENHKTDDPTKAIIDMCDEILILWDEQNPESSEKLAIMCADAGKSIKDLTMALVPIVIEGSPAQEPTQVETVTDDAQVSPFSRDELMNMNIGVLRRQAKSLGIENVGKTKQEIVDAIFYNELVDDSQPIISSTPVFEDDEMSVEEWNSTVGNGVLIWTHTEEGHGDIATRDITPEEVIKILELLGPC